MFVGGNLVTWRSKKQNVMTRSSVEVDYTARQRNMWTIMIVKLMELKMSKANGLSLFCNSKAAIIRIVNDLVQHDRTKKVKDWSTLEKGELKKIVNDSLNASHLASKEQLLTYWPMVKQQSFPHFSLQARHVYLCNIQLKGEYWDPIIMGMKLVI